MADQERAANDVMAVDDFLAQYRPASANERTWTWAEEEADILARECLCCGQAGHYQQQLEAHLARASVVEGICVGPDGRVWDGHHRITAARRLGIRWLTLESPEENAERWLRDHGPVDWNDRKTGDKHTCPTTPCEEPMHGTR